MELLYYTAFCKICPLNTKSNQINSEKETKNVKAFCKIQQNTIQSVNLYPNRMILSGIYCQVKTAVKWALTADKQENIVLYFEENSIGIKFTVFDIVPKIWYSVDRL